MSELKKSANNCIQARLQYSIKGKNILRVKTHCHIIFKSHITNAMKIHQMPNTGNTILLQILYVNQQPLLDYVTD
jgi:hypothetical protein